MRAGRLRHRLQLQQVTRTKDEVGGYSSAWTTTATVWGAVEALKGKEFMVSAEETGAGQMNSETVLRIIVRYGADWAGLDETWRVRNANTGSTYDIVSVIKPEETNQPNTYFQLMAKQGKTDDE
jgi:SPP1 family predicted phage head-tail adaptor